MLIPSCNNGEGWRHRQATIITQHKEKYVCFLGPLLIVQATQIPCLPLLFLSCMIRISSEHCYGGSLCFVLKYDLTISCKR